MKAKIIAHIQELFSQGKLTYGSRVSEDSIANALNISRTPVRSALQYFIDNGVFVTIPRFGTIVKQPDLSDIEDLYETRIAIEGYAIARVIAECSDGEIAQLGKPLESMLAISRKHKGKKQLSFEVYDELNAHDVAFHAAIVSGSKNKLLMRMMQNARMLTRINCQFRDDDFNPAKIKKIHEIHFGIFQAIVDRDCKLAQERLFEHIREGKKGTLGHIKKIIERNRALKESGEPLSEELYNLATIQNL